MYVRRVYVGTPLFFYLTQNSLRAVKGFQEGSSWAKNCQVGSKRGQVKSSQCGGSRGQDKLRLLKRNQGCIKNAFNRLLWNIKGIVIFPDGIITICFVTMLAKKACCSQGNKNNSIRLFLHHT